MWIAAKWNLNIKFECRHEIERENGSWYSIVYASFENRSTFGMAAKREEDNQIQIKESHRIILLQQNL